MKRFNVESIFPLGALVILVIFLSQQNFLVPPLGKLLNPFSGIVQNENETPCAKGQHELRMPGLTGTVRVFFDNRLVPHIFADNERDLYYAQGYVTASLRLWQMDILSYASAGRLSEIFREGFLDHDRSQRRMGLPDASKACLQLMEEDPATHEALTAYTKGVNAYIAGLTYKDLPFEYKFLDYKPEPWTDLKTVLVMKSMANLLSGYEDDLAMTNLMVALGERSFNKYFPNYHDYSDPVTGQAGGAPNPALHYVSKPAFLDYSFLSSGSVLPPNAGYDPRLGSNGWVVSGKMTRTGYPILANDPHLNLSLPAVWMEVQLSSLRCNVYGASIPGVPAVIIGFNRNIAWGLTNGADDVKDWYKLKISSDYTQYEMDHRWLELGKSVEEIRRRGQGPYYDTIYHTMHGPIVYSKSFPGQQPALLDHAMQWELAQPSNELQTFIKLNSAANYDEFRTALKTYACPIQNFMFADRTGDIGVVHQGRMHVKSPGQGKFILDGTRSGQLYTGYIPEDSLPQCKDPSCNYVLSANQQPTAGSYPYYYNGTYSENRANRIKSLLEGRKDLTVEDMKAIQLDDSVAFAERTMHEMIRLLDTARLSLPEQKALASLRTWKGNYNVEDDDAELYELWWGNMKEYTWDEFRQYSFYAHPPDDHILLEMLRNEPANPYFDLQGTSKVETAGDIVVKAFSDAVSAAGRLRKEGKVSWGDFHRVNLQHISHIPQLGRMQIRVPGHPEAINAMSGSWGPSWRMVVALGERPVAFGIYAGGQSGNVASFHYDDFIDDWSKGKYYSLQYFMSVAEAEKNATTTWILKQ